MLLSIHTRLESPSRGYDFVFRALDRLLVRPLVSRWKPTYVVMDRLMDTYIHERYRPAAGKTVAIPVGVHVDPHLVERRGGAAVRERHDLGDRPVILSLGHVIPLRDRVLLIEALPKVVARFPDARLVVVGAVHYPRFLQRAAELGVEDSIVSTGAVPREQIASYLAAADIEAHDLQGYGLGTASLEAMASGVPVVAAVRADNFPGITLRDGENITLVPEGDPDALAEALCRLLADPELGARIGAGQIALVNEHFSIEAVSASHLRVLADLAGGTDGAAS